MVPPVEFIGLAAGVAGGRIEVYVAKRKEAREKRKGKCAKRFRLLKFLSSRPSSALRQ
jgi:hypothetical protein